MLYNFPLMWRLMTRSFFSSRGTYAPLKPKRVVFLIIFFLIWPPYQLITWFFLFLDEILFPKYHQQVVDKPLFILGNFRSGSTFIHRLLSRDFRTFTSMRTVDIFLMPSITQRKIFKFFARIDQIVGSPLQKGIKGVDGQSLGKVQIHKISMFEPEEDENILLHTWSTFFVSFMFPFLDDLPAFIKFDEEMPDREKQKIMSFYHSCVQRHLYAHGGNIHFVSKSPASSAKIRSLMATFPDARILYLARNPLDMLPSTVSWLSYAWNMFSDTGSKYIYQKQIMELARYWYEYPIRVIDENPSPNHLILNYDDLVRYPEVMIRKIYFSFGYHESPGLKKIIKRAIEETRAHRSDHQYNYEQMGFDRATILDTFKVVFERFGYPQGDSDLPTALRTPSVDPTTKDLSPPLFSAETQMAND